MKKNGCLKVFLLLFSVNCLYHGHACAQPFPYKFNYLTVDNGLSHTDANDIVQDDRGYIWIATLYGLDRYDGYTIKKYYNRNIPLNNAYRNRVICLFPDQSGNIWLGSEDGLQRFDIRSERYFDYKDPRNPGNPGFGKIYKPAGNKFYGLAGDRLRAYLIRQNSLEEETLSLPSGIRITDMAPDRNGNLYLSSNKGLWKIDKDERCTPIPITGFPASGMSGLYFDNAGHLLIIYQNAVFQTVRTAGAEISSPDVVLAAGKRFILDNNSSIKNIVEGSNADYWINTNSALVRIDANLNLIQKVSSGNFDLGLNAGTITKVFVDRSQCLWACTFGGGVNYCDLNEKPFYTLQHLPIANSLSGNHIRSILEDGNDLWIGTDANGLNRYDLRTETFQHYNNADPLLKLKSNAVSSMVLDNGHNLWIGSRTGIQILKPGRNELWRPAGYDSFPDYGIETLAKDCFGNIWFGNHTDRFGVIWKDKHDRFHVNYYGEGFFILADERVPQLFISSTQGLKRIIIDEQGNIKKTFYYLASPKSNSLSSNYTYPVARQDDSTYWIGTIGGGLDRLSLQTRDSLYSVRSYSDQDGIFNDVESLEIDKAGNIWIAGNGLECLNPSTGKLVRYDKNDGLQGNSFKIASYKGSDGRLYFGGINGLNYFYPDQIRINGIAARPVLTDILINNKEARYGSPDSSENSIGQMIGYGNELRLDHRQNNFVIYFSSMHFANPLKCQYRYKLDGFDKDWKFTDGKNPSAAYSNLDYQQYSFIVEATNNDGIWSAHRAETSITILPPWWSSALAKIIYILLVLSGLAGIYIYQARWHRLKRELDIRALNEKRREEIHVQREQLYQQQLIFFTNISHELRTPLSLIMGPLESLMGQHKNASPDQLYPLMFRNAKRLVNLISELMNFKKVADSVIKLHVQPLAIHEFCQELVRDFQILAESKGIGFEMTDRTEARHPAPLTGPFDVQILEKILLNLLDNSFKYTEAGGRICFDVFFDMDGFTPSFPNGFVLPNEAYRAKKYIYFRVADTGIGISGESLLNIFDRYYRVGTHHLGSGIGLALVKNLTQLHKGDIYVYSERQQGTEIIIGLPWGAENYDPSETLSPANSQEVWLEPTDNTLYSPLPILQDEERPASHRSRKRILLVDDNDELRTFLKQSLELNYIVLEASDGHAAVEMAAEKMPDLIISDLMMPVMNGMEFCKLIKEKFETRHIPFIILSAKDAVDTKIEGMESGADYYFSKPLSVDLLRLTVQNIFEQAENLRQRYVKDYLSEASDLVHSEKDKAFLQEFVHLIEDNIQDPDLDVDFLCEHLYLSRTKLYQKIQSISDQSVAEFIRTIRLKKAIQIMTQEGVPMNDVAYRIGMQSSSNFSRAFKKEYGVSPIQFLQSLKKT